jgi:hypothetical protein
VFHPNWTSSSLQVVATKELATLCNWTLSDLQVVVIKELAALLYISLPLWTFIIRRLLLNICKHEAL